MTHCSFLFSPVHFPRQVNYRTRCLHLGWCVTACFVLEVFSIGIERVGFYNFIQKLHPEWNCPGQKHLN